MNPLSYGGTPHRIILKSSICCKTPTPTRSISHSAQMNESFDEEAAPMASHFLPLLELVTFSSATFIGSKNPFEDEEDCPPNLLDLTSV